MSKSLTRKALYLCEEDDSVNKSKASKEKKIAITQQKRQGKTNKIDMYVNKGIAICMKIKIVFCIKKIGSNFYFYIILICMILTNEH